MKVFQSKAANAEELARSLEVVPGLQLALVFGPPQLLKDPGLLAALQLAMPGAILGGCSTAGEITAEGIGEDSLVVTGVGFDQVRAAFALTDLAGMPDSWEAGKRLGEGIRAEGLRAVLLFGQGVAINGSAVIEGLQSVIGASIPITGGLAGDGARFMETVVFTPQGASSQALMAIGLYGSGLRISHGSFGGWETFGTLRKVTKSAGNVLCELDGRRALDIYKEYLGDYAKDLPSSGLLFPFEMVDRQQGSTGVIRTILAIDEAAGSLTLAGAIDPEGYLQLMHASTDRLIDGAEAAAEAARSMKAHPGEALALLVSCVGRKLVMGERVDEEIEAVAGVFGPQTVLAGFYSYGEISPSAPGASCQLHNQTMTVTWISEQA